MGFSAENLTLTDFMDVPTLQEIQDSFAAVADVKATITDADGTVLTQPTPTREFLRRQKVLAEEGGSTQKEGTEYVAPIIVNNQRLGTIRMSGRVSINGVDDEKLAALSSKYGLDSRQIRSLATQIAKSRNSRGAAIQFLFLLANAIARLCYQEFQLRQRINELTAVYGVAMMLADARDLQQVLQRTVQVVADVMDTKAASLRLYDPEREELVIKAVYNLSAEYLNKGPIYLAKAEIDKIALGVEGFEYVENMGTDPRVLYPQESIREGIVSMLSVGMRYKGKVIGVLRVYTERQVTFGKMKIELLKAVAAQAAAAIENARLLNESIEAAALEKQVQMAADVQQRMVPHRPPEVPGVELASVYLPCYELGGDFFDFIPLPDDNLGLTVADVSGKGVPASLIMASVRAFLRAQVDNVYNLNEVIRRINLMLCRDTKLGEFVTLFYGVLNARTRRLTYCNAGHVPPLLLRDGKVTEVPGDNLVLGVNTEENYKQFIFDLQQGDVLLIYTDGLTDAMNFDGQRFDRPRVIEALQMGGESAEAISQNILWHLRRFVGMAKRTDDVTMIVARIV
jgi:serine phosphatase RsbU (regulator of sigma subunit)/ligand-binding sensor protein/chorismate mutase